MANPNSSGVSLEQILHDTRTHTFFLDYLQKKHAECLLLFWCDCEQFKQLLGKPVEILSEAKKIRAIHFDASSRTAQLLGSTEVSRVLKNPPCSSLDVFYSAQRECVRQLRAHFFTGFLQSKLCRDMAVDFKAWTLAEVYRDRQRTRALLLWLQVEKPDFTDTLRFALDVRNVYKPLVAEGLAPGHKGKIALLHRVLDLGKSFEKKYLSTLDKRTFARGVSTTSASRVSLRLEEISKKLEQAMNPNPPGGGGGSGPQSLPPQHILSPKWAGATNTTTSMAAPVNSTPSKHISHPSTAAVVMTPLMVEDTFKQLGDVFSKSEEEANAWLEKFALVEARKADYFLSPVNLLHEEEEIVILRCNGPEWAYRLSGPHRLNIAATIEAKMTHHLEISTTFVSSKEEGPKMATDLTGATVSANSRGLRFRTAISKRTSFVDPVVLTTTPLHASSKEEEKTSTTSLAGISQAESIAENLARSKRHLFNHSTLESTELHSFCFPLAVAVDVDKVEDSSNSLPPPHAGLTYSHAFVSLCKPTQHSFQYNCQCVFGVCQTSTVRKSFSVSKQDHELNQSTLTRLGSTGSSASFSNRSSSRLGSSSNEATYSECAVWVPKVANFGLGLNLALNRDGSVVVTRFVSDVKTPSPAATVGVIKMEDELLQVNRLSVHGRKFDDIVGQIKQSPSPVHLYFSRGSFVRFEDEDESLFSVTCPETICLTSNKAIFNEMFDQLAEREVQLEAIPFSAQDSFHHLFSVLSVSHVVDLISSLMMDRRVLVVSDFPERLAPSIMSLLQLLHPLTWRHALCPFLPESHWDSFALSTHDKPFLAGVCTVDQCPVVGIPDSSFEAQQASRRHQGRLTLREEEWSVQERDSEWPHERFTRNRTNGTLRACVPLLHTVDTILVDLDADVMTGPVDYFPVEIKSLLTERFLQALGRGGGNSKLHQQQHQTSTSVGVELKHALVSALHLLHLHRVSEFTLSFSDRGLVGFYRQAFFEKIAVNNKEMAHFLERFTRTEMFHEFASNGWDLSQG